MLGIDLLALSAAGFLELAQYNGSCQAQKAPEVSVVASTKDVRYNFTIPKAQLANRKIDTVSPYSHTENTYVGGLMEGEIQIRSNVNIQRATHPTTRQTCFWYDTVNIQIEIDPTILVAREFPRGTCQHNEILNHEKKHVAVDRIIVKKYRKVMEGYLRDILTRVSVYGPVHAAKAPAVKKEMSDYIEKALDNVTTKMYAERRQRQQAVDNKNEYDRVSNACN